MKLFRLDWQEIWKLSVRDIKESIHRNKWKYIGIVFLMLIFYFNFRVQLHAYYEDSSADASLMDLLLYVCKGKPFFNPDMRTRYEIPFMWLGMQMYISFLIGNYADEDRTRLGQQYIYRTTHMGNWLAGKVVFCIFNCILFYLILFATCFVLTVPVSHSIFTIHEEMNLVTSCLHIERHTLADLYRGVFLMPLATSIILAVLQTVLQLVMKPIFSYLGILLYCLASDFMLSYYLIGNYSMIVRNVQENAVDGITNSAQFIDPFLGLIIETGLFFGLFLIGQCILRKYDYLERE